MSILVRSDISVLVQGITGKEGHFHAQKMISYGTRIVAGVTPGKGGDWVMDGKIPVFDSVKTAIEATGAEASVIFVPADHAADAIYEAVEAQLRYVFCVTEGIPMQDMMRIKRYMQTSETQLIGPNSPGLLSPGKIKLGIIPGEVAKPGNIGVISRSGTLTYEIVNELSKAGAGISTCIGIGGDPILGTGYPELLELFEADPETEKILIIGEIGGRFEENAVRYISQHNTKPVYAYIVGKSAPEGRRMGHAGAIIEKRAGSAAYKNELIKNAGIRLASSIEEIPALLLKS
ncbi:succinate--CoA ligase subunit alpha [Pelolinea submarina]|uniref:Succinate--CoA ligase [ADP-forming] subunit alpha n=1 Tax=Pelolinea submarina TaxID=913107 RepID=A0A347ZTU3_9CHLR|nr:succinate--CoA ligase subunit alpha [Pelolinea submarina]REG10695.1 succinyl-CoA synthetase alpha subunit [Pelolinea submarina]BBB48724.1 succinyl-CoA synthetase alpha subunit [Pelolinea submarina]